MTRSDARARAACPASAAATDEREQTLNQILTGRRPGRRACRRSPLEDVGERPAWRSSRVSARLPAEREPSAGTREPGTRRELVVAAARMRGRSALGAHRAPVPQRHRAAGHVRTDDRTGPDSGLRSPPQAARAPGRCCRAAVRARGGRGADRARGDLGARAVRRARRLTVAGVPQSNMILLSEVTTIKQIFLLVLLHLDKIDKPLCYSKFYFVYYLMKSFLTYCLFEFHLLS